MANNTNLNPGNMDNLGPGNSNTDGNTMDPSNDKDVSPQGNSSSATTTNKKYLGESELIKEPTKKLTLQLKDGSVTTSKIADGAVTMKKTLGIQAYIDNKGKVLQTQINSILRTLSSIGQGTAYDLTSEGGIVRLLMFIDDGQPYPAVVGTIPNGAVWYSPDDGLYHVWHDTTPEGETEQTGEWEEWIPTGNEILFDLTTNKLKRYDTEIYALVDLTPSNSEESRIITLKACLEQIPYVPLTTDDPEYDQQAIWEEMGYTLGDYVLGLQNLAVFRLTETTDRGWQFSSIDVPEDEWKFVYDSSNKTLGICVNVGRALGRVILLGDYEYIDNSKVDHVNVEMYDGTGIVPAGRSAKGAYISTVNKYEEESEAGLIPYANSFAPGIMSPEDKQFIDQQRSRDESGYYAKASDLEGLGDGDNTKVQDVLVDGWTAVLTENGIRKAYIDTLYNKGYGVLIKSQYWTTDAPVVEQTANVTWLFHDSLGTDEGGILYMCNTHGRQRIHTGVYIVIKESANNTPFLFIPNPISRGLLIPMGGIQVNTGDFNEDEEDTASNSPASQRSIKAFVEKSIEKAAGKILIPDYCCPPSGIDTLDDGKIWYDTTNKILKVGIEGSAANYLNNGESIILCDKTATPYDVLFYTQVTEDATVVTSLVSNNSGNSSQSSKGIPIMPVKYWDEQRTAGLFEGDIIFRTNPNQLSIISNGAEVMFANGTFLLINNSRLGHGESYLFFASFGSGTLKKIDNAPNPDIGVLKEWKSRVYCPDYWETTLPDIEENEISDGALGFAVNANMLYQAAGGEWVDFIKDTEGKYLMYNSNNNKLYVLYPGVNYLPISGTDSFESEAEFWKVLIGLPNYVPFSSTAPPDIEEGGLYYNTVENTLYRCTEKSTDCGILTFRIRKRWSEYKPSSNGDLRIKINSSEEIKIGITNNISYGDASSASDSNTLVGKIKNALEIIGYEESDNDETEEWSKGTYYVTEELASDVNLLFPNNTPFNATYGSVIKFIIKAFNKGRILAFDDAFQTSSTTDAVYGLYVAPCSNLQIIYSTAEQGDPFFLAPDTFAEASDVVMDSGAILPRLVDLSNDNDEIDELVEEIADLTDQLSEKISSIVTTDYTYQVNGDGYSWSNIAILPSMFRSGTTEERQAVENAAIGTCFFDTTLGYPVWLAVDPEDESEEPGTIWVNASGENVDAGENVGE